MMKRIAIALWTCCLACFLLHGCQLFERRQQAGLAVELDGHYLYETTLDSLTLGLSGEDSMHIVQQYISQWAKDILMYESVSNRSEELEAMVDAYRRSLYMHAYEEALVSMRMPKTVADSTIEQMYARMPERFRLNESILKGTLIVVPNGAPKIKELRDKLGSLHNAKSADNSKAMDFIEKYAYQYASGYELFTNKGMTSSDLVQYIPLDHEDLEAQLRAQSQIEMSDSAQTYILQVIDKRLRGEQMPLEYARPEIEKLVLSSRQNEFLQKERERLYQEAIQEKRIKFYNKN